jgi:predicted Zn-dependent protease
LEAGLIGERRCAEILDKALRASRAEAAEAVVHALGLSLTRFANNTIHQNVAETNTVLTVRAVIGLRQGSATTNDLSDAGIERAAETAQALALAAPADPDFPGLPAGAVPALAEGFDDATASYSPEARARAASLVCRRAADAGLVASGAFRTGVRENALANSNGLRAYHAGTLADLVTVVLGDDAAGQAQQSGWRAAGLDPEGAGAQAVDKAVRGANPRRLPPGDYPVILEPYAVYDIVQHLATAGMSAEAVREGRSWMTGRRGERLMSPHVTIWDDGYDPAGIPLPFDAEGVQRKKLDVVSAGVVGEAAHDMRTAAHEGTASTGHAAPPEYRRWRTGPLPINLFMAPGGAALDDLVASTERGLYVSRFWYTRVVHPRDCVITGMTRDGLFWIENGEIAYPVKNLRFTQSYVNALAAVEAAGAEGRLLADAYGYGTKVPALKIGQWRFTGSTS